MSEDKEGTNLYTRGNMGGRPPVYETPEELEKRVGEYFDWIKGEVNEKEPYYDNPVTGERCKNYTRQPEKKTMTGMALFLGFESRQSMYDYKKKEGPFSYIIKRASLIIENRYEDNLDKNNNSGSIFALKNMGWRDKVETENINHNNNQNIEIGYDEEDE